MVAISLSGSGEGLGRETGRGYSTKRILFQSELHGGQLKVLEVRGGELTREEQIAHLARCLPERQQAKE
jgi:hypothetical protein